MFCCSLNFFLTHHYRYFSFPFFEALSLHPDLFSRVCFTRMGIKMFRYANIWGFSLLSPYKIAVHEIDIFLLKITLSFTLSIRIQWARCSFSVQEKSVCSNPGEEMSECIQQGRKKLPDELQNWGQRRDSRSGMTATICSLQHNFHIHKGLPGWYCYAPQARSFLWRADGMLFPGCLNRRMSVLLSLF